jgi:hypothetical protein
VGLTLASISLWSAASASNDISNVPGASKSSLTRQSGTVVR